MFAEIFSKTKTIDILVNTVGNFVYKKLWDYSFADFQDTIESNLYSVFLCTEQVLPGMKKKKWGRIINFGCADCQNPSQRKNAAPYYSAKSGLLLLTKSWAQELRQFGVTVNMISPGVVETSAVLPSNLRAGQLVKVAEIAAAAESFLDPQNAQSTGTNLEIAKGWKP